MTLNESLIQQIEDSSPQESIKLVADMFPGGVVFSSSLGQEDQVLADVIFRNNLDVKVFTLDTGRLFNETYELLDRTLARYKKPIQVFYPDASDVETFVNTKGINAF